MLRVLLGILSSFMPFFKYTMYDRDNYTSRHRMQSLGQGMHYDNNKNMCDFTKKRGYLHAQNLTRYLAIIHGFVKNKPRMTGITIIRVIACNPIPRAQNAQKA